MAIVAVLFLGLLVVAFLIGGFIIESISKAARGENTKGEPFWGTTTSYVLSVIIGLIILAMLFRGCDAVFF